MTNNNQSEETEESEGESDSDNEPDGAVTRGQALADARGVLTQEMTADTELATKAWRSVQFSGLSATIFAGLVVPHLTIDHFNLFASIALIAAALSLGVSAFIGVRQQDSIEISLGPETKYYRAIANHDYDADEYLKKTLKLYANAIDEINEEIEEKARKVKIALYTSVLGIVFLLVAIIYLFA